MLPISYSDATPLLRALAGPVAPVNWRGALPLTYHLGPGPATVHLKLSFDWKQTPVYDVVGRLRGAEEPDQWIIRGNHHDAWVCGADDPVSGTVALLEEARAVGSWLAGNGSPAEPSFTQSGMARNPGFWDRPSGPRPMPTNCAPRRRFTLTAIPISVDF